MITLTTRRSGFVPTRKDLTVGVMRNPDLEARVRAIGAPRLQRLVDELAAATARGEVTPSVDELEALAYMLECAGCARLAARVRSWVR